MNRTKLLSIMPYVLGVLILILVGVIIMTGLEGDESGANPSPTPTQAVSKEDDADKNITAEPGSDDTVAPDTGDEPTDDIETGDTPDEGNSPAVEPETTPTAAPTPTPTTAPTPTPITDLTMGYKFENKADYVDTKDGVNLRMGASTDTDVVAMLEVGQRLERTGYNDEWTRVIYNGQECYIATRLIIREVESIDTVVEPTAAPTEAPEEPAAPTEEAPEEPATPTEEAQNNGPFDYATYAATLEKKSYYGSGKGMTVCIDPGHQAKGNSEKEANGPGSTKMANKCESGTAGALSGDEYLLDLKVSLMLQTELTNRGYKVVMTRTTNDVNLSNVERAQIANDCDADAFIRVHANGMDDPSVEGMETLCMSSDSPYNADLYEQSYRLSANVLDCMVDRTGAKKRYIWPTDEKTGINWSEVPVTIAEIGYMTNAKEDKLFTDDTYLAKIVVGIADGIDLYFSK